MSPRLASVTLLFAVVIGDAEAQEQAVIDSPERLCEAVEKQELTPALGFGAAVVEKHPDSPTAYVCYGSALLALSDLAGAIEQYEKALELAPKEMYVHYSLAEALSVKDAVRAKKHLLLAQTYAVEPDPDIDSLAVAIDRVLRLEGGAGQSPEGDRHALFVHKMIKKAENDGVGEALFQYARPALVSVAKSAGLGRMAPGKMAGFAKGAAKGLRTALLGERARYVGAEVGATRALDSGNVAVTVHYLVRRRWSRKQVDALRQAYQSEAQRKYMDADTRNTLDRLSPKYQREFYANLGKEEVIYEVEFELLLREKGGKLAVYDFQAGAVNVGKLGMLYKQTVPEEKRGGGRKFGSDAERIGYQIGRFMGPLLIVLVIVWWVRRRAKE